MISQNLMKPIAGNALIGDASCLVSNRPLNVASEYRRRVGKGYRFVTDKQLASEVNKKRAHWSRKYDGIMCMLAYKDGEAILVTPGGTVWQGLKALRDAEASLAGAPETYIACEFYYSRPDGKRERVYDVTSHARKPKDAEDADRLCIATFQVYESGGRPLNFKGGREMLDALRKTENFHPAEGGWAEGAQITENYERIIEEGGEGIVVIGEDFRCKAKPRHNIDCAIVGYATRLDKPDELHDLLLAVIRPDGLYQIIGHVGGGFSDDERADIPGLLSPLSCTSNFTSASSERVAYTFVRPNIVAEISVLDFFDATADNEPIEQAALSYTNDTWKSEGLRPFVSMYSPQFIRLREDKDGTDRLDARAEQVADLVGVDIESAAVVTDFPEANVLKREVYTKEHRGARMLRKVLVLEQPAAKVEQGFPRYAVVSVDYSPNRAEPMKKDVKFSENQTETMDFYTEAAGELFKGGWNVVAGKVA